MQVVYKDFTSSNILLDLDFSMKLAGHGLDVIPRHCHVDASAVSVFAMPSKSERACHRLL